MKNALLVSFLLLWAFGWAMLPEVIALVRPVFDLPAYLHAAAEVLR